MLSHFSHVRPFVTLGTPCSTELLCPQESQGKNTSVGYHAPLQGIFPTQDSNPHLLCPALAGGFFTPSAIWEAHIIVYMCPNSWNYILTMDELYCMYSFYICIEKCTFVWEAGGKSTIIPSEEYIPKLDFRSQHFCGTADFASSYHVSEWNTSWESGFSQ